VRVNGIPGVVVELVEDESNWAGFSFLNGSIRVLGLARMRHKERKRMDTYHDEAGKKSGIH
jgi:hypothetical protein